MTQLLDTLNQVVWGIPLLALMVGVGVYLTWILRGIQFRYLGYALRLVLGKENQGTGAGDISHFQSLMTALAATMGVGNIAGVATAFVTGGPGALFWMWVTALLGMAIKYVEAYLAVKYRVVDKNGQMSGGPMYFIEKALNLKWLAVIFAFCGILASLGGGNMLQSNSIADVMETVFKIDPLYTGIILAAFMGLILLGGIKAIGRVASVLVPVMAILYLLGALVVIALCYEVIPQAVMQILVHAFTPHAAVGGFIGSTIMMAMQVGVSKGLMTSEAGLGTASIAAAAAKTDLPGRQAMVSMTSSFLSTVIMCSVTALVLGVTQVLGTVNAEGETVMGASLTALAFDAIVPNGSYIVAISVILFGFTTILGWSYYSERCLVYLAGERYISAFRFFFVLTVLCGALLHIEAVWKISDIANGLMAIPNLVAIALLGRQVALENEDFLALVKKERSIVSL